MYAKVIVDITHEKLDKILNAADWQHLLLPISSL